MSGPHEDLLERERELAAIDDVLAAVREGRGGVLLIEGPPGIGKSSLLAAAQRGAGGVRALAARGAPLEREFPFGVARQLVVDVAAAGELDEPGQIHALHRRLDELAAEQPTLLVVDDLHLADEGSLRTLLYVARRIEGLPLGLLAATHPIARIDRGTLALLAAEPHAAVCRPAPLSSRAVDALIADRLGSSNPAWVAACERACEGNPLLLREVLAAARDRGLAPERDDPTALPSLVSRGLEREVAGRLGALGEAARAVARALAVLGPGASAAGAFELAGLARSEGDAALALLDAAHLLRGGPELALSHPLVEAAVLAGLGPQATIQLHRRAADVLHRAGEGSERVAGHLLRCGAAGDAWAVEVLLDAAEAARGRAAHGVAAELFDRALEEGPAPDQRPRLRAEAGTARLAAGDAAGLDDILAVRAAAPPPARAGLTLRVMAPMWFRGRAPEVGALLRECVEDGPPGDPALALALHAARAQSVFMGSGEDAQAAVDAALAAAAAAPPDAGPRVRWALGLVAMATLCAGRPHAEAVALARTALGEDRDDASLPGAGFAPFGSVGVLAVTGHDDGLDRVFAAIEREFRRRGSIAHLASTYAWRGRWHLCRGRLRDAEADARTAISMWPASWTTARLDGACVLARALIERGEPAQAIEEATAAVADAPAGLLQALCRLEIARGHLATGQAREAATLAADVGATCGAIGLDAPAMLSWRPVAARALIALGDREAAATLARAELARAEAVGAETAAGQAQCLLGLAEGAVELLDAAERRLAAGPAPLAHAEALFELGAARRRSGARAASREPLLAALELAHACGADVLVARATVELRAAGARPRRIVRTGVDALTASELRVARLAASGMSNREIAQHLFVSPKTVETQLYAGFRKLDVRQRAELGSIPDLG